MWYYESMITIDDINRLYGGKDTQERLINNAAKACKNAESDWAKNFWFSTFSKLCKKFDRTDLYNKHLH